MPQICSKLTNRYQTTIPRRVREALNLEKHDKIRYTLQSDGALLSRADMDKEDPVLADFLVFLANDMSKNPQNISAVNSDLHDRIKSLVSDVEIDLDSPLSDEDE